MWSELLFYLLCLFTVLTACSVGIMAIYKSEGKITGGKFDFLARLSMGNFQGAQSSCFNQFLSQKGVDQYITCPRGKISKISHWGIIADRKDQ